MRILKITLNDLLILSADNFTFDILRKKIPLSLLFAVPA